MQPSAMVDVLVVALIVSLFVCTSSILIEVYIKLTERAKRSEVEVARLKQVCVELKGRIERFEVNEAHLKQQLREDSVVLHLVCSTLEQPWM